MKKIVTVKKVRWCGGCDYLTGPTYFGNDIAGGYTAYCRKKFNKKIFETIWGTYTEMKKRKIQAFRPIKIPVWCPLEDYKD